MPGFVYKLLITQLALGLSAMLMGFLIAGANAAQAALLGAGIGIAGTFFGARRSFSAGPGSSPDQIWRALVRGEAVKAALVISALMICLQHLNEGQLWLVGTLLATLVATRVSLLLTDTPGKPRR